MPCLLGRRGAADDVLAEPERNALPDILSASLRLLVWFHTRTAWGEEPSHSGVLLVQVAPAAPDRVRMLLVVHHEDCKVSCSCHACVFCSSGTFCAAIDGPLSEAGCGLPICSALHPLA